MPVVAVVLAKLATDWITGISVLVLVVVLAVGAVGTDAPLGLGDDFWWMRRQFAEQ